MKRRILAAPTPLTSGKLLMALAPITLAAAQSEGNRPTFTMNAYNGGLMYLAGWFNPVIVDLAGVKAMGKTLPALRQHDMEKIVGHITGVDITPVGITATGIVSGSGQDAEEVVASSKNGFPWQASIGADPARVEFLEAGKKTTVNGQEVTGPANIVRECTLFEISFVPVGADMTTSASVAASTPFSQENPMEFEAWLKAKGFDKATLSASQLAILKAAFDNKASDDDVTAIKAAFDPKTDPAPEPKSKVEGATDKGGDDETDRQIKAARVKRAAESKRVAGIEAACAGKHAELEAKAIEEGWSVEKTELEVLRAERPKAPAAVIHGSPNADSEVITAALCRAGKLDNLEKAFTPKTLEAADRHYRRGIGLQELLITAAVANGYSGNHFQAARGDLKNLLAYAFASRGIQAAVSTISIPGILSTVANKFLLAGWMSVEQTWRMIASIRPVNDFKTVTSYRLNGNLQYDKVAADGQLKHGDLGETSYTNKADTYGKILGISRQDIINDDLGAITGAPRMLGRGGALKLNDVFWTEFCADSATFWTTARGNYFSGAGALSVLGIDSLSTAVKMFREQTDPDGKPLGVAPKILLVPPALEAPATQLVRSTEIRDTTASTKFPTANPHAGNYTPAISSYLSNASYGNSSTAWWLLADPADLALIEVAFLNGQETPTVESAEAEFNTLGIEMRGYHDFGVKKQEYRAGVKSKGAA